MCLVLISCAHGLIVVKWHTDVFADFIRRTNPFDTYKICVCLLALTYFVCELCRSSKALSSLDTLAQQGQAAQEMNLRKSKRELFVQRAMEKRAAAAASGADTTK